MKLFVGLGNPGAKYAKNRHNIGFMALDEIAREHGFAPWRGKFQGSVSEGRLGTEKVILLKPETFMNLSGQSVGEAMRFYKLTPEDVVVFHDELDLAPGRLKVKQGGGHAGHNGLRSMHQHLGDGYGRVRMGIGHPGQKNMVSGYVLKDFAKADQEWLSDVLIGIGQGAAHLAQGDGGRFMNVVAQRKAPTKPSKKPKSSNLSLNMPQPSAQSGAQAVSAPAKINAKSPPQPEGDDTRSRLQKLADKFR